MRGKRDTVMKRLEPSLRSGTGELITHFSRIGVLSLPNIVIRLVELRAETRQSCRIRFSYHSQNVQDEEIQKHRLGGWYSRLDVSRYQTTISMRHLYSPFK